MMPRAAALASAYLGRDLLWPTASARVCALWQIMIRACGRKKPGTATVNFVPNRTITPSSLPYGWSCTVLSQHMRKSAGQGSSAWREGEHDLCAVLSGAMAVEGEGETMVL